MSRLYCAYKWQHYKKRVGQQIYIYKLSFHLCCARPLIGHGVATTTKTCGRSTTRPSAARWIRIGCAVSSVYALCATFYTVPSQILIRQLSAGGLDREREDNIAGLPKYQECSRSVSPAAFRNNSQNAPSSSLSLVAIPTLKKKGEEIGTETSIHTAVIGCMVARVSSPPVRATHLVCNVR